MAWRQSAFRNESLPSKEAFRGASGAVDTLQVDRDYDGESASAFPDAGAAPLESSQRWSALLSVEESLEASSSKKAPLLSQRRHNKRNRKLDQLFVLVSLGFIATLALQTGTIAYTESKLQQLSSGLPADQQPQKTPQGDTTTLKAARQEKAAASFQSPEATDDDEVFEPVKYPRSIKGLPETDRQQERGARNVSEEQQEAPLPFPPIPSEAAVMDLFEAHFLPPFSEGPVIDSADGFLDNSQQAIEGFKKFVKKYLASDILATEPTTDEERRERDWMLFKMYISSLSKAEREALTDLRSWCQWRDAEDQQRRCSARLLELYHLKEEAAREWLDYHIVEGLHPDERMGAKVSQMLKAMAIHYGRLAKRHRLVSATDALQPQLFDQGAKQIYKTYSQLLGDEDAWLAHLIP